MATVSNQSNLQKVAIIGGGISGSTAALTLAQKGLEVTVFERNASLISGPPICHLHAGGNLYREISQQQCLTLLRQSIDTVRLFQHTLNVRPTVIAVPITDPGSPSAMIPRLKVIQAAYQTLVDQDQNNQVLGDPSEYYKLYSCQELEAMKERNQPVTPASLDDWMVPFAQQVDLDKMKFPVVVVQEYGWSVFRLSASANLALASFDNCALRLNTSVTNIAQQNNQWRVSYSCAKSACSEPSSGEDEPITTEVFDYLINACGFETGTVDDWVQAPRQRLVEFKAAYVTHWPVCDQLWPEVIFHGPRGTPQGMAQLTPYPNGHFQLHGMTEEITLFSDGLVASCEQSSQPSLPSRLKRKVKQGWSKQELVERSEKAIAHMSQFIPGFKSAQVAGKPLYGAQQIPGESVTLRAADVSFAGCNYARMEVVKGSSALDASVKIFEQMQKSNWLISADDAEPIASPIHQLCAEQIERKAEQLANLRGYPAVLAQSFPSLSSIEE